MVNFCMYFNKQITTFFRRKKSDNKINYQINSHVRLSKSIYLLCLLFIFILLSKKNSVVKKLSHNIIKSEFYDKFDKIKKRYIKF